ncbi:hypothetical protein ACP70R_008380 [Stipagrostis hirtigluma subsp. patula]
MMKRKKQTVDLKTLWERAAKAQKVPKPRPGLLECLRFILCQGLACPGHDGSENSLNIIELLSWLAENFGQVSSKVLLRNAPKDAPMSCPKMQKDLVTASAKETTRLIMQDLGEENFAVLAGGFNDVYHNDQLTLCLRYVDKKGRVVERFVGAARIENMTASALKTAIESLLVDHSLSLCRVRGQGYDGASNLKDYINGLKKLVMDESPSAYYVHCFPHHLHLSLAAVAKENDACIDFFEQLSFLLSIFGISCKRPPVLQAGQAQEVLQALQVEIGRCLNQEMFYLDRPDATDRSDATVKLDDSHLGSHYKVVMHIFLFYPTIRRVLIMMGKDHTQIAEALKAQTMLRYFESFEFVFMVHLLLEIFGITHVLARYLLIKDHRHKIVNAIGVVRTTKKLLALLREDDGWKKFLKDVTTFCEKHNIEVPSMDGIYEPVFRSKRFFREVKNLHRFHSEIFLSVINGQLREFNDRFDEVNMDLLVCMESFNPSESFAAYDKDKLLKLARFYPMDFSGTDLLHLPSHLTHFISDMRRDERFRKVENLPELSVMLVETKKSLNHPMVYKLLKLVLVLPVVTATVKREFSVVNFMKNKLCNRVGEQLLNDCLVTFVEPEFFMQVKDEALISRFQSM